MSENSSGEKLKIPFRTRFQAWWAGVDPESLLEEGGDDVEYEEHPEAIHIEEPEEEKEYWNPDRLDFLTRLWGGEDQDEVISPGGIEYSLMLAKPMGLDSSKTVLDLAAGLGGPTRALAKEFNVWIEGMESDEDLAEKANDLSVKYGMERRAPITGFNPDTLELKDGRFDAIIMRESMYKFNRKDQILKNIYGSLKPSGHFMMTDFALKSQSSPDVPAVAAWLDGHDKKPMLWSMEEYKRAIVKTRMNLHIHEDRTDEFRVQALTAWADYVGTLTKEDLTREIVNQLMEEAQYWLRLIRAMESGEVRFMRIHATKGGESIL